MPRGCPSYRGFTVINSLLSQVGGAKLVRTLPMVLPKKWWGKVTTFAKEWSKVANNSSVLLVERLYILFKTHEGGGGPTFMKWTCSLFLATLQTYCTTLQIVQIWHLKVEHLKTFHTSVLFPKGPFAMGNRQILNDATAPNIEFFILSWLFWEIHSWKVCEGHP